MLNHVFCDFCGRPAREVECLETVAGASICNHCVSAMARKMGLLPAKAALDEAPVRETLAQTFTHALELDGHLDQKYDVFLFMCLMDILRADHWNVSIELRRVARVDGFVRADAALGKTRYAVELLCRSAEPVSPEAIRAMLEESWAALMAANSRLIADKGTRDLLEPRLASLAAYVVSRAGSNSPSRSSGAGG